MRKLCDRCLGDKVEKDEDGNVIKETDEDGNLVTNGDPDGKDKPCELCLGKGYTEISFM